MKERTTTCIYERTEDKINNLVSVYCSRGAIYCDILRHDTCEAINYHFYCVTLCLVEQDIIGITSNRTPVFSLSKVMDEDTQVVGRAERAPKV